MTGKIVLSRKRSDDPAQEHLREQKAIWNESAKNLISRLIAFKRGLNGRGDPRAGLPPSRIQDPFPPEIGSYLNVLADEYLSVVKGAESIIKEQEHYSQNRRQPQSTLPMAVEDGFVSEASWWGSRLKSRLPWVGLSGPGRQQLLLILSNSQSIENSLFDLENFLSSSAPEAIFRAFYTAKKLGSGAFLNILTNLKRLAEKELLVLEKENNNSEPLKPKETPKSVVVKDESPPAKPSEEEEPGDIVLPQVSFDSIPPTVPQVENVFNWDKAIHIFNDLPGVFLVLSRLSKLNLIDSATASEKQNIEKIRKIIRFRKRKSIPVELIKEWEVISPVYDHVLQTASEVLKAPGTSNFKDLIKYLPEMKEAHNALTRYLKRKWLQHKPEFLKDEDIDGRKLNAIDHILASLDALDEFMDVVEKNPRPEVVLEYFQAFAKKLHAVYQDLEILADLYNSIYEQLEKENRRTFHLSPIKKSDITELKKMSDMISSIQSLKLEEHSSEK